MKNPLPYLAVLALAACDPVLPVPDGGGNRSDGGFFTDFTPPPATAVNNSLLVTITGEGSATGGTGFPPTAGAGEPYFLDGWELHYEHVLVTVGQLSVSEGPDTDPNDQSVTGPLVAEVVGPWAVDLAKAGPLDSKEMNGKAWPLARITRQDKKSGTPAFDPTAKYAFGYSLLTAVEGAQNVNLDADAEAAYRTMAQRGWSVLLQGTATWKGDQACRSTNAAYDFGRFPKAVKFSFGFKAPVHFKNCVNPELQPLDSRGVQTATNAQTLTQVTFHLDHPFWESLAEDSPLRFDAIAARRSAASGAGPASVDVTLADLAIDLQAPRDAQDAPIPWRTCGPVQAGERSAGTVSYDPVNVPVNPAGGADGLKDLADYMTWNLSTFGHLNNDGLCFPDRQYPSPR
ncbi:MAG: hypothetical protein Q8L48_24675 [Archangium sp.]|nr:hypothetical protein [Archangium sp.]